MVSLRIVHGWIEFDENVTNLDALPVVNMNRSTHADFERLDDLGAAAGNDLAWRRCHNIDRSQACPSQRDTEEVNDRRPDGAPDRRGRRLGRLKRRREATERGPPAARPPASGHER